MTCLAQPMYFRVLQNVATLMLTPNLAIHSCWISWRYIPGLLMINLSKSTCSNSPRSLGGPWCWEQGFTSPVLWNRSIYLLTDLSDRQSCSAISLTLRLWAVWSHTTLYRRFVEYTRGMIFKICARERWAGLPQIQNVWTRVAPAPNFQACARRSLSTNWKTSVLQLVWERD